MLKSRMNGVVTPLPRVTLQRIKITVTSRFTIFMFLRTESLGSGTCVSHKADGVEGCVSFRTPQQLITHLQYSHEASLMNYSVLRTAEEFFTAEHNFNQGQNLEEHWLELTGLDKSTRLLATDVSKIKAEERMKIFEYILLVSPTRLFYFFIDI
jgi:hypothetical protein